MEKYDFVLAEEDVSLLDYSLLRYVEETGVAMALLMSRAGHLVCRQGPNTDIQADSLCALAVGTFASSEALARLAGEDTFNSIFHQGVRSNVYIALVGEDYLLLSLFNYRASAPLVRLQAKITAEAIIDIVERANARRRDTRTEL